MTGLRAGSGLPVPCRGGLPHAGSGLPVPCRSDARYGHPALRSLDAGSLSASMPSLASNAGSTARATPRGPCSMYALRSLDAGSLSASMPSLASNAGSTARATPRGPRSMFALRSLGAGLLSVGSWCVVHAVFVFRQRRRGDTRCCHASLGAGGRGGGRARTSLLTPSPPRSSRGEPSAPATRPFRFARGRGPA